MAIPNYFWCDSSIRDGHFLIILLWGVLECVRHGGISSRHLFYCIHLMPTFIDQKLILSCQTYEDPCIFDCIASICLLIQIVNHFWLSINSLKANVSMCQQSDITHHVIRIVSKPIYIESFQSYI